MVLNTDAGMVGPDSPTIVYGLRGLVLFEIRIDGPKADLHSGLFGGVVANPAIVLSEIIASLHAPDGSVAVPWVLRSSLTSDHQRESPHSCKPNRESDYSP